MTAVNIRRINNVFSLPSKMSYSFNLICVISFFVSLPHCFYRELEKLMNKLSSCNFPDNSRRKNNRKWKDRKNMCFAAWTITDRACFRDERYNIQQIHTKKFHWEFFVVVAYSVRVVKISHFNVFVIFLCFCCFCHHP